MAEKNESILSQLLLRTLDSSSDHETAAQSLLRYLQDSASSASTPGEGGEGRAEAAAGREDIDCDRFHKSFQKVIQDNKIFGHQITNSSSADVSLQLLNELTSRYVTAKELQQKYSLLETNIPQSSEQQVSQEYPLLLLHEKNMKQSLQKLYEMRSHAMTTSLPSSSSRLLPTEERMILFKRKYRVSSFTTSSVIPLTPLSSTHPSSLLVTCFRELNWFGTPRQ